MTTIPFASNIVGAAPDTVPGIPFRLRFRLAVEQAVLVAVQWAIILAFASAGLLAGTWWFLSDQAELRTRALNGQRAWDAYQFAVQQQQQRQPPAP